MSPPSKIRESKAKTVVFLSFFNSLDVDSYLDQLVENRRTRGFTTQLILQSVELNS